MRSDAEKKQYKKEIIRIIKASDDIDYLMAVYTFVIVYLHSTKKE